MSVSYSFCKQSNKVHPPSSPYITQKIRQIWFSCKGRRPRNKKTKGAAETQRNGWLCITESRKPGFLGKNSSVHTPSGAPKTYGSYGSGSGTLLSTPFLRSMSIRGIIDEILMVEVSVKSPFWSQKDILLGFGRIYVSFRFKMILREKLSHLLVCL